MTRPCPWCLAPQPLVPSIAGMTWSVAAKNHMWECQFDFQFEYVPAAPAGTGGPASAPRSAPSQASFPGRTTTSTFRRLSSAVSRGSGRRRKTLQGESRWV